MERGRPDLFASLPLRTVAVKPVAITPWWRNRRLVPFVVQPLVGLVVLVLVAFLVGNLVRNLTAAGLLLSWSWLDNPAGFDIAESSIPFSASQP